MNRQVGRVVPGLAVVAASSDEVLLDRGFGLADRESGAAMSSRSICSWFSMTKLVTATAVVQLAERGALDLDAPLVGYYEPFAAMRPPARAEQVTVRHLLSHSGGVANPLPLRWVHLANEAGPAPDELVGGLLAKHRRLRFDPGAKAAYTNLGYLVLGEVVACVAAQPFPEYVRANVLGPLEMTSTDFVAVAEGEWATPYQRRHTILSALLPVLIPRKTIGRKDGGFVALRHFYVDGAAYGGLVGPAADAIRFARASLRGGELDGTRILSEQSCREMQTIATRGRKLEVGLGWLRRSAPSGADFVEHLGGGAGFWSCLRLYPTRDRAVVVMGNATAYDHEDIVGALVDGAR